MTLRLTRTEAFSDRGSDGSGTTTALVGRREGWDRCGSPRGGRVGQRGGTAMAGLLAAGLHLAAGGSQGASGASWRCVGSATVPLVSKAPLVAADDGREVTPHRAAMPAAAPSIEIRLAGAVIRVPVGTDGALLTQVLRAVRASAA